MSGTVEVVIGWWKGYGGAGVGAGIDLETLLCWQQKEKKGNKGRGCGGDNTSANGGGYA